MYTQRNAKFITAYEGFEPLKIRTAEKSENIEDNTKQNSLPSISPARIQIEEEDDEEPSKVGNNTISSLNYN